MFTSFQTIVYLSDGNRKCFAKLSNFKKNFRKKHLEISKLQRAVNIFIGISRNTNTLVVVMPINCRADGGLCIALVLIPVLKREGMHHVGEPNNRTKLYRTFNILLIKQELSKSLCLSVCLTSSLIK